VWPTYILWSHHAETRELPGERDNARNNARCTQSRKATHGLGGQHQDVAIVQFSSPFVTYWLLDLPSSFYSLPSNDPQLSWAPHQLYPALPVATPLDGGRSVMSTISVYRRRPGLPGRRTHHLEQPAGQRDICPVCQPSVSV